MPVSVQERKVHLTLPPLHPQQAEFVNDPHRIVVAACGTKTGKTFGLSIWMALNAWNTYQSLNWWCAPTYRQAKIAFKLIGNLLPTYDQRRVRTSRTDLVYELLRADG